MQVATDEQNLSFPNTFVLVGFSDYPWLESPLFGVLLVSYIFTLIGNSSIIFLSLVEPRLQTPRYFFCAGPLCHMHHCPTAACQSLGARKDSRLLELCDTGLPLPLDQLH